jgi:2-isopropylmalate synthase
LGIHTHNDSDLAVANSLLAVKGGCTMVQGTINGLGERCGNANLCSVIPNLTLKENYQTIPDAQLQKLYYVSHLVSELSNQAHNHYLPFVGSRAFAHKGGIHVSAVRKNSRTYEHIVPELVGNKRSISVSELSGKSNILEKAKEMGIEPEQAGASAKKVLQHIKELENNGYHFEGAEASFELLYKSLLGQLKEYFNLHGYRVIISKDSSGKTWSEATIKGSVPEEVCRQNNISEPVEHTSADAGGPVEALDRALRKVLEKFYPALKEVKLTDYKVRILNEDAGTKATTRVLINSMDSKRCWGTVGVSDNIIDASWQALVDAFIYKIIKDEEEKEKIHDETN